MKTMSSSNQQQESIPSTPHNQKRDSTSGPVPNLISTVRNDNRDQLLSILSLDPTSNDVSLLNQHPQSGQPPSSPHQTPIISHRQRLIFATDSLRTLLLYHTLFHPDRHQSSANKKKKGGPNINRPNVKTTYANLTHDELALGLDYYNPYGIINTRILFPSSHTCSTHVPFSTGAGFSGPDDYLMRTIGDFTNNDTSTSTATNLHGTETIYGGAPSSPSSNAGKHASSLFDIHHDTIYDDENNISVVLYFILPIPEHVKAVSKIITHQYNTQALNSTKSTSNSNSPSRRNNPHNNPFQPTSVSSPTRKIKHRIIFLQRLTKLCTQILYNENILPTPGTHNNDNINKNSNNHHNQNLNILVNAQKNIVVHSLDIDLVPIEDDILTLLDTSGTMKDVSPICGIPSLHVNCIASSIMKIQTICNSSGGSEDDADNDTNTTAITDMQGCIPRMQSFGKVSESVLKRCFELRTEEYHELCMSTNNESISAAGSTMMYQGDIQALMILDRRVDLVTPMLTPLTYEGLLDDVLSIESGVLHVKTDIISPPDDDEIKEGEEKDERSHSLSSKASKQKKKNDKKDKPIYTLLPLNDQDTLYVEVRDQHVEKFGSFLQEQAKALKESHANFSNKDKDLTEIHMFVKQIPIFTQNLKSLTHHIHLAELVKHTTMQSEFRQRWQIERSILESESCFDVIEDMIASQHNVWRVLRLLCLHSLTNGGVKTNKLDALKREIVQTYGYEFVFLLQNLESIGLLRKKDTLWDTTSSSAFGTLRKQLRLIQPDVDPLNPDDVSYVSSGYAPISARIIQTAVMGWTGKEESLREIPGRSIDVIQQYPPEEFSTALKKMVSTPLGTWETNLKKIRLKKNNSGSVEKKPILIVYFVGGVTYAEIAAMRFMSKRSSFPFQIVCCTTKIINGTSFLQSLA